MDTKNYHCFICCHATVKSTNSSEEDNLLNELGRTDGNSLLSTNLEVIFVLKKLLEVPSIHLENQLKECGGDPGSWVKLCDQCTQLTRKARKLDQELRKIEMQLRSVSKQVVEKMVNSMRLQEDVNDDLRQKAYLDPDSLTFEEKIRSFVKTHDYAEDPDGFLEGDKLAKYLATQQNSSTAQIIIVEVEKPLVIANEEIKLEVEPPPSPLSPPSWSPAEEEEDLLNPGSSSEVSKEDDEDCVKKKKTKREKMAKKKAPERKGIIRKECKRKKYFNGTLFGIGKIKCGECGKKFKRIKKWSEHVRNKHERRDLKCPGEGCGMHFEDNFVEFQEHWEREHEKICNYCGMELENYEMLKKHKNNKHYNRNGEPKGPWICDICGEENFKSYRIFLRHRKLKHQVNIKGEPWFKLKMAQVSVKKNVAQVSVKKNVDQDAVQMKKEMRKLLCNLCGKEYCDKWSLNKHLKHVHDKEKSFSCHVCGLGIDNQKNLNIHLLAMHKEDPVARKLEEDEGLKLTRCEVKGCAGKFLKEEELDKHMEKMHKGGQLVNRFECEVCGMGFWLKKRLELHQKVHGKKERRGSSENGS